jgi:hypothetical protein
MLVALETAFSTRPYTPAIVLTIIMRPGGGITPRIGEHKKAPPDGSTLPKLSSKFEIGRRVE